MIVGSVCSGIAADAAAWSPLGWRHSFFSEIAPFPSRVLAHHYPQTENLGDFTTISAERAAGIDLLVGGTPCQSFSVAGLRGGLADERGQLALEFLRLAARAEPRWLVWENVPGVLSADGGRAFGSFLGGLAELGYGFAYRVLDAQHFGVAQRRRRVFVVGHARGAWKRAAAVLFDSPSMCRDSAPRRAPRSDVAGCLEARARTGGVDFGSHGASVGHVFATTTGVDVAHCLRGTGHDASEDGTGRGTPIVAPIPFETDQITHPENRSRCEPGSPAPTRKRRSTAPAVAFHLTQDPISGAVAPALCRKTGGQGVMESAGVRRLTPTECERLMGFADGYTAIPGAKDGPRYAALGNSIAVPVLRWIGERIARVDAIAEVAS